MDEIFKKSINPIIFYVTNPDPSKSPKSYNKKAVGNFIDINRICFSKKFN
jgi:hypothetical protein